MTVIGWSSSDFLLNIGTGVRVCLCKGKQRTAEHALCKHPFNFSIPGLFLGPHGCKLLRSYGKGMKNQISVSIRTLSSCCVTKLMHTYSTEYWMLSPYLLAPICYRLLFWWSALKSLQLFNFYSGLNGYIWVFHKNEMKMQEEKKTKKKRTFLIYHLANHFATHYINLATTCRGPNPQAGNIWCALHLCALAITVILASWGQGKWVANTLLAVMGTD